jgi:hypothetical protein
VQFCKGQRKDEVTAEHLRRFARKEGIVLVGKAQEDTPVFRTERRRNPKTRSAVSVDRARQRAGLPLLHLRGRS